eukprot:8530368-Heterocapsa_arctica.AAC.1
MNVKAVANDIGDTLFACSARCSSSTAGVPPPTSPLGGRRAATSAAGVPPPMSPLGGRRALTSTA